MKREGERERRRDDGGINYLGSTGNKEEAVFSGQARGTLPCLEFLLKEAGLQWQTCEQSVENQWQTAVALS